MTFHCFSKKFQCCLTITTLCRKAFQAFPFVIHSPPRIMRLAVDLHEHLIKMPLPACPRPPSINPSAPNLSGKQWAKSVSPKADRLMAGLDATLVQQVLNTPTRKRKSTYIKTASRMKLGRFLKIAKWAAFCHPQK